jgi:hypothetical protein
MFVSAPSECNPRCIFSVETFTEGDNMKYPSMLIAAIAALGLSACDRPSVVEVPAQTQAAPAPSTTIVEVPRHEERPVVVEHPEERRSESVTVDKGDHSVTVTKSQESR